jgi:hypothetical protein
MAKKRRHVEEMTASPPHKEAIHGASTIYRNDTDDHGPLKLVWAMKDDCCRIRQGFEHVLERCL